MRTLSDDALDLTGALGVDFVNTEVTVDGARIDLLASPDLLLHWMSRAGGPPLVALAPESWPARRTLTLEARALREALRDIFSAVAGGEEPPPGSATLVVDRALRGASAGFGLGETRHAADGVWRPRVDRIFTGAGPATALAPIALSAMEVLSSVEPDRLRPCAAPDCRRWFVDTSRGGRRRWCSMARCGNRRKAARYRQRHAEDG